MSHTVVVESMSYDGTSHIDSYLCECPLGYDHDEQEMHAAGFHPG